MASPIPTSELRARRGHRKGYRSVSVSDDWNSFRSPLLANSSRTDLADTQILMNYGITFLPRFLSASAIARSRVFRLETIGTIGTAGTIGTGFPRIVQSTS